MRKKVCVSGYYGFDNFGDETILKVLSENLNGFGYEVTVFSSSPKKTAALNKVKSVNSFSLKDVVKSIFSCDCLVSGGGSLLQDVTSKKSLVYYLFIITLAQFFGKKTVIFAQGVGPVRNKFLSLLTGLVLKNASYVSVRDEKSLEFAKKFNKNSVLCCDPVWNIRKIEKQHNGIVAIQLRAFSTLTDEFIKELACAVNKFYSNKTIHVLSLQNTQDIQVSEKFKNFIKEINPDINVKIFENTSNEKVIYDLCQADEVIAMRYHACLIAIKNGIKLLPLSYDVKVQKLAERFGLDYIDIENAKNIEDKISEFAKKEIAYDNSQIDTMHYDFTEIAKIIG